MQQGDGSDVKVASDEYYECGETNETEMIMRLLSLIEVLFRAAESLQDSCETCFEKQAGKSSRLRRKKILVSDHHTETSRELSACSTSGSKVALKLLARSMWSVHACVYYSVIGMVLLLSCFARLESQIWSHAHHPSHSIQPLHLERLSFSDRIVYRRQEFNRKILIPGSASEQSNAVQLQQEPISHSLVSSQEPSSAFSQELLLQFNGSKADDSDHVCRGKRIYIYDLPPEFNSDLVARCRYGITSWLNFCPHTSNDGLGATLDCGEKLPWKFAPTGLTTTTTTNTTTTTAVPDDAFTKGWYKTDPYMLELIFHSRLQSYPCRTSNSAIADVFFIPYYTGLDALRYLYNTTEQTDTHGVKLVAWFKENAGEKWTLNGGNDHFMVLGRTSWDFDVVTDGAESWGTGIRSLPPMKNVTGLFLERKPWLENEQAVPYPTSFHPSAPELFHWLAKVRSIERRSLFAFAGATRAHLKDSIRSRLLQQCSGSVACSLINCHQLQCSHNPKPIMNVFLQSKFCLQPRGDTPTRRSTFDGMIAGCIPVFFHEHSAYTQYTLHFPADRNSYSVYISEERIISGASIEAELLKFSEEKIQQMRETIVSFIPKLLYTRHSNEAGFQSVQGDAFDTTIEGVLKKVATYKDQVKLS